MKAWLLAMIATIPFAEPLRDAVPVVERNAYYDEDGRLVLSQVIFRDENTAIMAWRFDRDLLRQYHPPCLIWFDEGKLRRVTAGSWVSSWTQTDPERDQLEVLPLTERRGLSR